MTQPAIVVDKLSKAYRIGLKEEVHDTLIGAFTGMLKAPWKNWRHLSRLNTFRNLDDADDTFWALRDVSFEVAEGEVIGIIGRNGAGKSTLLKILSRITEPTSGRAIIRGRVSSLLEVGTGFHQELSGRENIYMNGTILGMTKREIDRKFDEIVEFSGVEKFLDTPIKYYSTGMKVRLAFSVAANLEPEILIIDEVLAVGDAEFQNKCLGKMQDVARGGRTVLFVSHNMAAVEALCQRGVELQEGQLIFLGPIVDVMADYRRRVSDTLGSAQRVFSDTRYIRRIEVIDASGRLSNVVPIGQDLRLRITFDPERTVVHPVIVVRVDDVLGHRLLTIQPPTNCRSIGKLEGRTIIECVIHEFPLAPGSYLLTVVLLDNQELLERIVESTSIAVVNAYVFDEGRGFVRGICVARSSWTRLTAAEMEREYAIRSAD
jgi:lipopolysaccharide transport system ATP-binding protein